ncbi:hypothetical protein O9929_27315 [Vibrio lentus]|nr:hypothetical protein [Vibrio lentus]
MWKIYTCRRTPKWMLPNRRKASRSVVTRHDILRLQTHRRFLGPPAVLIGKDYDEAVRILLDR